MKTNAIPGITNEISQNVTFKVFALVNIALLERKIIMFYTFRSSLRKIFFLRVE